MFFSIQVAKPTKYIIIEENDFMFPILKKETMTPPTPRPELEINFEYNLIKISWYSFIAE